MCIVQPHIPVVLHLCCHLLTISVAVGQNAALARTTVAISRDSNYFSFFNSFNYNNLVPGGLLAPFICKPIQNHELGAEGRGQQAGGRIRRVGCG